MGRLPFGVTRATPTEGLCRSRAWEGAEAGVSTLQPPELGCAAPRAVPAPQRLHPPLWWVERGCRPRKPVGSQRWPLCPAPHSGDQETGCRCCFSRLVFSGFRWSWL